MSSLITCTYVIEEVKLRRNTASLRYIKLRCSIPSIKIKKRSGKQKPKKKKDIASKEPVKGHHLNCEYILDTLNSSLIVKGSSIKKNDECADHIIRTLNRNQDWRVYYSVFRSGCKDIRESNGLLSGFSDIRVAVSIVKPYSVDDFINSIQDEYKLPRFFEFLLSEAVFNCSLNKYRTAFFLIYTALERACKLLYFNHYGITTHHNPEIKIMLEKMQTDSALHLRVNLSDFGGKYRVIRNAIGHGETDDYIATNLGFNLKTESENLLKDIDLIFNQLSVLLEKNKKYL